MLEEMNQHIQTIKKIAKEAQRAESAANKTISQCDLEISDIYHFIEFGKYDAVEGWKILKALKEILLRRREAKNCICIISCISSNLASLSSKINNLHLKYFPEQKKYKVKTDVLQRLGLYSAQVIKDERAEDDS